MRSMNTAISRLLTLICLTHTLLYLSFPVAALDPSSPHSPLSHARRSAHSRMVLRHSDLAKGPKPVEYRREPSAIPAKNDLDARAAKAQADSLTTIKTRRAQAIIDSLNTQNKTIDAWLSTLSSAGKWPDSEVDYTTGCDARRANWPAQDHWIRISVMAAAWHGSLPGAESWIGNANLRSKISTAMDYWFGRDFTGTDCLANGGTDACPCSNPNNWLWNTNWFSNVILIPKLALQTGVLLGNTMTSGQTQHMVTMGSRSWNYGTGLTGANALDVSRIAMDQALITSDTSLLSTAYSRSHEELVIENTVRSDGIRADGAFGQHDGLLYNGNYGKDYTNDILGSELDAAGTEYAANAASQAAFGTLFDGDKWMIFRNSVTQVLHWDFSVIGRFITFPVADITQASATINLNLTSVGRLGSAWGSASLTNFASSLSGSTSHANAGNLIGNKMFFTNDYMVQRGSNYVTTVKMYSTRTRQSECTNSQDPFGFHLGDGAVYTYVTGAEYEDIFASWDWNLIPGITVDYNGTPLQCSNNANLGVEAFVGGASDGKSGAAAMRYTNPITNALKWQKTWFFLDNDVQYVMLSGLSSTSGAPVYSVLDQRKHSGSVYINGAVAKTQTGKSTTTATSLWHGNVGYKFSTAGSSLVVNVGSKTGNWSAIGTSEQTPTTVDLFSAYIQNQGADATFLAYAVFPGTTQSSFTTKASQLKLTTVSATSSISAVFDKTSEVLYATFWSSTGGSITFTPVSTTAPITVLSNRNAVVIYRVKDRKVIVSEPSQTQTTLQIRLVLGDGTAPWASTSRSKTFNFNLPTGGVAGSSLTQAV